MLGQNNAKDNLWKAIHFHYQNTIKILPMYRRSNTWQRKHSVYKGFFGSDLLEIVRIAKAQTAK